MTVERRDAGWTNGRNSRSRGSNAVMIPQIGYAASHKAGKREKIGHVSASPNLVCNLLCHTAPQFIFVHCHQKQAMLTA